MSDSTTTGPANDPHTLYQAFPHQFDSVILATVGATVGDARDGQERQRSIPHSSYAPFIMDPDKTLYIFTSELAVHTQDLLHTGVASVLFIEDEGKSTNIFARTRLTYDCEVTEVPRDAPEWSTHLDRFQDTFGDMIGMIRQLMDFHLLKLTPVGGRFTLGFGKIYDISGDDLTQLIPVTARMRKG